MKKISFSLFLFFLTFVLVAGDATLFSSTFYSGSQRINGETQRHLDGSGGVPSVTLSWKSFFDKGNIAVTPAILRDGSVIVATTSGYVMRMPGDGGAPMWTVWLGSVRSSPQLNQNEDIFLGSVDGYFYCLASNGNLKWKYRTNAPIAAAGLVTHDNARVVVPSRDFNLYFLNANDGSLLFQYNMGGEVRGQPSELRDGAVVCGSLNGSLVVINSNYTVRWSYFADSEIASRPLITDTLIVFSSRSTNTHGGTTFALRMDGSLYWYHNTSVAALDTMPVEGRMGEIYIGGADGRFYALMPDGSLKWRYVTGFPNSPPAICGNSLVFVSKNKFVYGLSFDGIFLWKYEMVRGTTVAPNCVSIASNSSVTAYVGSDDQTLYAINHNF